MPRLLATAIFVLFTGSASAFSAPADTGTAEFVRTLGNEALGVIRADMPPAQKQAFFHQLLQQNFDLPGIARFVLGPHWRTASEPEKQEFLRLFEDYIVRVYSERFAQYRGETLQVTGSRTDPEGAIVTSEIIRPGGAPPIKVDWRLTARDGLYKISDVIIDGVSMGVTERSEIAAMIQRSGGMQGLFAMMSEKAAAPAGALPAAVPPAAMPPAAAPPGALPPAPPPPAFPPPGIGAGLPPR
jgi:phospholipid transport system substrate-binding protein